MRVDVEPEDERGLWDVLPPHALIHQRPDQLPVPGHDARRHLRWQDRPAEQRLPEINPSPYRWIKRQHLATGVKATRIGKPQPRIGIKRSHQRREVMW